MAMVLRAASTQAILGDGNANLHQHLQQPHSSHAQSSKSVPNLKTSNSSLKSTKKGNSKSAYCVSKPYEDSQNVNNDNVIRINLSEHQVIEEVLVVHPRKSTDSVVIKPPPKKFSDQPILEPKSNKVVDSASSEKGLSESSPNKTQGTDYDTSDQFQRMYAVETEGDPSRNQKRDPRRFLDILICRWRPAQQRRLHQIDIRLLDPPIRSRFFSKVMTVKFIKWLCAMTMALSSPYIPQFAQIVTVEFWIISLPILVYFTTFVVLRTTPSCLSLPSCTAVIIIYTFCLGLIGSILFCTFVTSLIPTSMLTLCLTYGTLAMLTALTNSDLTRDSIVPTVILVVLSYSLVSFMIGSRILYLNDSSTVQQFGLIWFPSMMLTQTITLIEIAEMKAIIDGLRIDLSPYDWMIVAAFIL